MSKKTGKIVSFIFSPSGATLFYCSISSLWIIFSDQFLSGFSHTAGFIAEFQNVKGLAFVVVTSVLLFFYAKKGEARLLAFARDAEEKEDRYLHVLDRAPFVIAVHQNGKVVFCNTATLTLFGYKMQEVMGMDILQFVHPDFHNLVKDRTDVLLKDGELDAPERLKLVKKNGESFDVELYARLVKYNNKPAIQILAQNISEQLIREQALENMVREKTLLLSEVHHRVKNNMAIISGLMQLQSLETDDPKVNEILNESVSRVKSIALIHDHLYECQNLSKIQLDRNIRALVQSISGRYEGRKEVRFNYLLEKITLNINQSVSVGLFVNEVVNEIFRSAGAMTRTIEAKCTGDESLIKLEFKEIYNEESEEPALTIFEEGGWLMELMVQQLDGNVNLDQNRDGFKIEFSFKKKEWVRGTTAAEIL